MRGRTKLISLAAILTIIFVSSAVFASGAFDVKNMSLFSTPTYPDQTPHVFVDPDAVIGDYEDPAYAPGALIQVHVNVSDMAPDLFSYQVELTWTPGLLGFVRVVSYGDFLARTGSPYGTSRSQPTKKADNVTGYATVAETILGDYAGITGAGRLFTVEFEILDYGCTSIDIGTSGELPTALLDNTGAQIPFTSTSGYFKNKLLGDANGDRTVNILDMGTLSGRWTGAPGALPYSRDVDCNDDGSINILDMGAVSANWGRSAP
jgi:hypothetical protein